MKTRSHDRAVRVVLVGLSLLVGLGCGAESAQDDQRALSPTIVTGGKEYHVGYGYEVNTDKAKLPDAVAGTELYSSQGATSTLQISYIENSAQLQSVTSAELVVEAEGTLKVFTASGGYTRKTSEDIKITRNSIALFARQRVALGEYTFLAESLTPVGTQALADFPAFLELYGNTYLKSAIYAADLVYVYSYEYNETDETKRSEMKVKLKAGIEKVFGVSGSYTLTEDDKAKISALAKTGNAFTNVAGFVIPAVENIDQWRAAEQAFGAYIGAPTNSKYLQYVQATVKPYSALPSPVWSQHPEYKAILDKSVDFRSWQEQWIGHKNRITDISIATADAALQQQCVAALATIDAETSKIRSYSIDARAPRADEFKPIYDQYYAVAWHNVGAAGEPAFANNWANIGSMNGYSEPPARFRQLGKEVQVQLAVKGGAAARVFTLPPSHRPAYRLHFVGNDGPALSIATVDANGDVSIVASGSGADQNRRFSLQFVAEVAGSPSLAWQAVTFLNGWANTGSMNGFDEPPTRFARDGRGDVHIQIAAKSGQAATVFTLPPEYRPSHKLHFLGNDGGAVCILIVQPSGNVDIVASGRGADGYRRFNVRFPADPIALTEPAWHGVGGTQEPIFLNSWTNSGQQEAPSRFRMGPDKRVQIQVNVKGGVAARVFTLPLGYRPAHRLHFVGNDGPAFSIATVDPSGDVSIVSSASGADGYRRFNAIEFQAEP